MGIYGINNSDGFKTHRYMIRFALWLYAKDCVDFSAGYLYRLIGSNPYQRPEG